MGDLAGAVRGGTPINRDGQGDAQVGPQAVLLFPLLPDQGRPPAAGNRINPGGAKDGPRVPVPVQKNQMMDMGGESLGVRTVKDKVQTPAGEAEKLQHA